MAELIRYILLVNIFLMGLSLFFHIFLKRENGFRINRFILVGGIVLSLVIPLWQLNVINSPEQALIVISEDLVSPQFFNADVVFDEVQVYGQAPMVFPWLSLIQAIYFAGIMAAGILFLLKLQRIKLLQQTNPMVWHNNLFISLLPTHSSPFSFLGVVYFPKPFHPENETTQMVLDHERAHIRQKHSFDMILVEALKILFFYNPAVYSLQKQLVMTHEFLADAESADYNHMEAYSRALLESFFHTPALLIQPFKTSTLLKQRLIRLNQKPLGKWAYVKYTLFIPLLIAFITLSTYTTVIP